MLHRSSFIPGFDSSVLQGVSREAEAIARHSAGHFEGICRLVAAYRLMPGR
jgi:hypothetical protein